MGNSVQIPEYIITQAAQLGFTQSIIDPDLFISENKSILWYNGNSLVSVVKAIENNLN